MNLETSVQKNKNTIRESNMTGINAFRLVDYSSEYNAPGLFGLHFDIPKEKVNKLSPAIVEELAQVLDDVEKRTDIKTLVILSDKDNIFIAGADIDVIKTLKTKEDAALMAEQGERVLRRFEKMRFPVIAAVNGACMGGGTEFALCCKYIVVSDAPSTRIALPEVNLGIMPGFGGTVRMPERIGLQNALDFILTGKNMNGPKAVKLGFADACLPHQNFNARALAYGAQVLKGAVKKRERKVSFQEKALTQNLVGRAVLFSQARKMVMKKSRGKYPAPLAILDTMAEQASTSRDRRFKLEVTAFGALAVTDVSKRMIELFYASEAVKKQTGVTGYKLDAKDKAQSIGVLGAGVMGGGIAQLGAAKNLPVRMKDIDHKGLALGTQAATRIFSGLVKKKKLTKREADIKFALISPTTDYTGFEKLDIVVEAVVENMDVKKKVLKECEGHMRADAVFATNTSSLLVTEMATAAARPENVVGMHFFNPVHKMPLIEVIRGAKSSDRAVAVTFELSKRLGKTPIVVKDGPGFLVNRLLMPYLNEASYLMAEGAPIEELDEHVLDFGMPMGPATLLDEVGIDVGTKVAKILFEAFGARAEPCKLNSKLVDAKLYGKKANKGFYIYNNQGIQEGLNPDIYSVLGVEPKSPSKAQQADWIPRMMLCMVNEAAICLAEGIVATPQDVDVGMIFGTGFAPFRGGPLRWADTLGLKHIVAELERLSREVSPRFKPSPAILALAEKSNTFYRD